jgi:hypothetical protein
MAMAVDQGFGRHRLHLVAGLSPYSPTRGPSGKRHPLALKPRGFAVSSRAMSLLGPIFLLFLGLLGSAPARKSRRSAPRQPVNPRPSNAKSKAGPAGTSASWC